ncbi:cobalt ECF transporter T component CbiQ [Shimia sp. R9_1]|uniref:cobalt ECF transporter T component CbiQ n=1 Tax=Shimia sp. R9_1 TaxID=2821111 RepID=UPI001AD9C819|nr:cobalt ECF transporter T component CbiQ [Shimia sp. R9_1]MBO9409204.1 cobalt ECF transporter T component CbiQ [Shimia sp. R9_1]
MAHALEPQAKTLSEAGRASLYGKLTELDPRMRILAVCLFAVVTVALQTLSTLVAAFSVSLCLLILSGLPKRRTLKRMAMMDGFIIFMLVLMPFSMPGDAMFTVFGFPASWQGLWKAIEIALTANTVILALMVLVGTMEPVTLGHALHRLRCPEVLVHLLMFTIRYIEVLREEYLRLRGAMKIRGFRPGTNWHTYRSFGYLVGMMLVRAIERSERILSAMKCRGFSGRLFLLQDYALTRRDRLFAVSMFALCAGLLILDHL